MSRRSVRLSKRPQYVETSSDDDFEDAVEHTPSHIPKKKPDTVQDATSNISKKKPHASPADARSDCQTVSNNADSIQKVMEIEGGFNTRQEDDSSSSESDIENYLQPIDKIDFTSSFFDVTKKDNTFESVEKTIFAGVTRLSDSDDSDGESAIPKASDSRVDEAAKVAKLNFQKLQDYTNKIEEAKKKVEEYNAKKQAEEQKMDIGNLLAAGESITKAEQSALKEYGSLHSSDFESLSESEKEDWEEIRHKDGQEADKSIVPDKNLEITVQLPGHMKKKKANDLLAAVKRRLNRMRKENQVFIHKVHLLSWIAHGNYVNNTINGEKILCLALSLLPSQKSYPDGRIDLKYLEQIVKWYSKAVKVVEKVEPKDMTLENLLQLQMSQKEVYDKKMLVYIFIAILRALGIQCRLVISFQVEPLRPPTDELHSLSTKEMKLNEKGKNKVDNKELIEKKGTNSDETNKKPKEAKSVVTKEEISSKVSESKTTERSRKTSGKGSSTSRVSSTRGEQPQEKTSTTVKNSSPKKAVVSSVTRSAGGKNTIRFKSEESKISTEGETSKEESQKPKKDSAFNRKRYKSDSSEKQTSRGLSREATKLKKEKGISRKKVSSEASTSRKRHHSEATNGETPKDGETSSKVDKNQQSEITEEFKSASRGKSTSNSSKRGQNSSVSVSSMQSLGSVDPKLSKNPSESPVRRKSARFSEKDDDEDEVFEFEREIKTGTVQKKKKANVIKIKLPEKKKTIQQMDGVFDSDSDGSDSMHTPLDGTFTLPQCDGSGEGSKPDLKKLKQPSQESCSSKTHKLKSEEVVRSPFNRKNTDSPSVNFQKLRTRKSVGFYSPVSTVFQTPPNRMNVKNDIVQLIKGRINEQKQAEKSRLVKKRKAPTSVDSDNDSDYVAEETKKKHHDSDDDFVPKVKVKQRLQPRRSDEKKKSNKVISSDSEVEAPKKDSKKKKGMDVWVEVFVEEEEKWISVDVVNAQVHCVHELCSRASHPVSYIVAWNNDNTIKDITVRYCQNFNTVTRKLRVDKAWWDETLRPFLVKDTARNREEDEELSRMQLEKPLPTVISEYKNHPLYALERHLLKFEAIYPPNAAILGFVRNKEPVYSRDCVYVCKSRDIWLKEAKVVKPGEKPYKIVKARPKYDKLSNSMITDQMLEIFGPWQLEDYVPPTAENGIVPRNAFGNVELFKPCMLPKKTVHLKLPGLNKVARKLNIDCASAIVGFDFHGGWSHPVYDGFVVCEEFEDQLVAAWELEQEEMEKRDQEKLEKRVYGNWKRLIRGLLIRERLKAKYDFGAPSSGANKKKGKGPRFSTKKRIHSDSSDSDE